MGQAAAAVNNTFSAVSNTISQENWGADIISAYGGISALGNKLLPTGTTIQNSGDIAKIPSQLLGGAYQLLTQGDPQAAQKAAAAEQVAVNNAQSEQNDLIASEQTQKQNNDIASSKQAQANQNNAAASSRNALLNTVTPASPESDILGL